MSAFERTLKQLYRIVSYRDSQGRREFVQNAVTESGEAGEMLHWTGGERQCPDDNEGQ